MNKISIGFLLIFSSCLNCFGQTNGFHSFTRSKDDIPQIECTASWKLAHAGVCIGSQSLLTADIDNDGKTEIICSAGADMFDVGNYWYILECNPDDGLYYQTFVSRFYDYDDGRITVIELLDVDQDGQNEIVIGFDYRRIEIYDAISLQKENSVNLPYNNFGPNIIELELADLDNDGQQELICGCQDHTYILNATDLSLELELDFGAVEIACGNIDSDQNTEIVFSSGEVFEFSAGSLISEWKFKDFMYGIVKLRDVDDDGMDEIISASDSIYVYDADIRQLKFKVDTDNNVGLLILADTDGDGSGEIIYERYSNWENSLVCLSDNSGEVLWQMDIDASQVGVANTDNQGNKELIITTGSNTTGPDYITIYDIETFEQKWRSVAVEDPFTDIEIADSDDDGELEIIVLTAGNATGSWGGILSVYDLATYQLEWQSSDDFFPGYNYDFKDILVCDYDHDGSTEIVIPAGYDGGRIYVLDGSSHTIERDQSFYPDPTYLQDIEFMDGDGDGDHEFVVADRRNICFLNPQTFSIEWTSPDIPFTYDVLDVRMQAGNLDSDPNPEFVIINRYISIIDPATNGIWSNSDYYYSAFELFDYNSDGTDDIVAGTNDGKIVVINGITHEITELLDMNDESIGGINFTFLDYSNVPVMIFSMGGSVYFWDMLEDMRVSERLSEGGNDDILVIDTDNDGENEIFVASANQVIELGYDCYKCLGYKLNSQSTPYFCNEGGDIILDPEGGNPPYSFAWENGSTAAVLYDLPAGTYGVDVMDNQGCRIHEEFTLVQVEFGVYDVYKEPDNPLTGVCEGKARIYCFGGTFPLHFYIGDEELTVNNGYIEGLCAGSYSIRIVDGSECETTFELTIEAVLGISECHDDDLKVYPVPAADKVVVEFAGSASGIMNGSIKAEIVTLQGLVISELQLDFTRTEIDLSGFEQGIYLLRIFHGNGVWIKKLIVTGI